ncbi:hypothetical protein AB0I77_50785 [Streptomyces sp. NPDC050619]|uniref:hypothetical protein n=1 Tax=Streptomyces sp. NPDC050619 TaxID=3157214 RepID=UPI00341BD9FA
MPQTPTRPDRSTGEFADLFARKARTPLRGFLPGRRVWKAVGAVAATILVITGAATAVSRIDWSTDPQKVTAAAEKKAAKKHGSTKDGTPTTAPSSGAPTAEEDDKGQEVDPLPRGGGAGISGGGTSGGGSDTSRDEETTQEEQRDPSSQSTTSSPQEPADYLSSDGSLDSSDDNGYWDQSIVTVKSTKALKSLKVVVKVIQTGGVADTGVWTSLDDKVSVASGSTSGELDYVVTLKSGVTLDPGTYVFKFGYNHDQGGRDAGGDRYNVTATSTASVTEFRKGGF